MNLSRMSWISSGFIGVILATIYSLCIKSLSSSVAHGPLYFYVMSLCWVLTTALSDREGSLPSMRDVFLLFLAGLFSFLGNSAEIESIARAPQLGYVSALKMSQVIFVTILSLVFLKKRSLSFLGVIGILLIIAGNVAISFWSQSGTVESKSGWEALALFAAGSFAVMVTIATELSSRMKVSAILVYFLPVATLLYAFSGIGKGESFVINFVDLPLVALAGISAALSNIFQLDSIVRAPQPGYGSAIISTQIVFITIGALFIFANETITFMGALGLLSVVLGAVLISRFAKD